MDYDWGVPVFGAYFRKPPYGGFHQWGYPQIIHFNGIIQLSILGYPHLWKPPYGKSSFYPTPFLGGELQPLERWWPVNSPTFETSNSLRLWMFDPWVLLGIWLHGFLGSISLFQVFAGEIDRFIGPMSCLVAKNMPSCDGDNLGACSQVLFEYETHKDRWTRMVNKDQKWVV